MLESVYYSLISQETFGLLVQLTSTTSCEAHHNMGSDMSASASPGYKKSEDHTVDSSLPIRMAERPNTSHTTSSREGTPKSSSKGLTVDKMLEMYPKQNVEWAIFSPDYIGYDMLSRMWNLS